MIAAVRSSLRRAAALLSYCVVVIALACIAALALADLRDRMSAVAQEREILDHLDGRQHLRAGNSTADATLDGSPFLEGSTVTVAGAALQERVGAAVSKSGGNVLSSQIELQGPQAARGYVDLSEIFEIEQASLQPLLYDLEAGSPFMFVDSLVVQSPQALGEPEGARMRVQIGVSAQWRPPR
jgi:general secretion pathway protein M